jgi:hypothetical protein
MSFFFVAPRRRKMLGFDLLEALIAWLVRLFEFHISKLELANNPCTQKQRETYVGGLGLHSTTTKFLNKLFCENGRCLSARVNLCPWRYSLVVSPRAIRKKWYTQRAIG